MKPVPEKQKMFYLNTIAAAIIEETINKMKACVKNLYTNRRPSLNVASIYCSLTLCFPVDSEGVSLVKNVLKQDIEFCSL